MEIPTGAGTGEKVSGRELASQGDEEEEEEEEDREKEAVRGRG